ncbi:hypothetical protein ASG01_03240 [Chryseobacterium sp. Leaf180]|uniref:SusE domain-containing protein n=1 Tax=Chryseobacterium sp. Leaf180 TaxID=1736289 RepID=UPI000701167C|nr:SusE domain-containing protein [Chryseobacterium sp. Leaf180]KQR94894.1 hypothetical protein ASG01_03240 [Chryseobacterium sp. Leaf180]
MRNFIKILFLGLFVSVLFSCDNEDEKIILNNTAPGSLAVNKTAVNLDELIADQSALTFTYVNPTFSPNIVFTNEVEIAVAGTNFSPSKKVIVSKESNSFSLTHVQLNTILADLMVAPNVAKNVEFRLKTSANSVTAFYSPSVAVSVKGYTPNPDLVYPKINVPGNYAGAAGYQDWTPTNTANLFSPEKDSKYRGFIYVSAANSEYKFTINQDYTGDKGDDGTFTGKLVETGEVNLKAATAGTYYIKVDWLANTYSTAIMNFGVIGDATPTGYASDTDFVYNPTTKTYVINSIALNSTGVFKFRANDDWAVKIQPASTDQTLVTGTGVKVFISNEGTVTGDPSYKVGVAGNYKIELDLHNSANYKLTVTKL